MNFVYSSVTALRAPHVNKNNMHVGMHRLENKQETTVTVSVYQRHTIYKHNTELEVIA